VCGLSTAAARLDGDVDDVSMRSVTSSVTTSARAAPRDDVDDDDYVSDMNTTRPPPALFAQVVTS